MEIVDTEFSGEIRNISYYLVVPLLSQERKLRNCLLLAEKNTCVHISKEELFKSSKSMRISILLLEKYFVKYCKI